MSFSNISKSVTTTYSTNKNPQTTSTFVRMMLPLSIALLTSSCSFFDATFKAIGEVCGQENIMVTSLYEGDDKSEVCRDDESCNLHDAIFTAQFCNNNQKIVLTEGEYRLNSKVTPPADEVSDVKQREYAQQERVGKVGLPRINRKVHIIGNGAVIYRYTGSLGSNGEPGVSNESFRVFHVMSAGELTLENLTIKSGVAGAGSVHQDGGAILNEGKLTLQNVTLRENVATKSGGALFNANIAEIFDSRFVDNKQNNSHMSTVNGGGAIANMKLTGRAAVEGTGVPTPNLTITNSALKGNRANARAGALLSTGEVTISMSEISNGNNANNGAGVIEAYGSTSIIDSVIEGNFANKGGRGSIYVGRLGSLDLIRSTVSGNQNSRPRDVVAGIMVGEGGIARLRESTVYANVNGPDIGVHPMGSLGIKNSIIDDPGQTDTCVFEGTVQVEGINMTTDNSCFITDVVRFDDLKLGPLADNGGPTLTHALLDDSPAIDYAGLGCYSTDQRGLPRPVDGNNSGSAECDVGAFEKQ